MNQFERLRSGQTPVTVILAGVVIASFLASFFTKNQLLTYLQFTRDWFSQPWSLILYPFGTTLSAGPFGAISLFFLVAWLLFVGSDLERAYGRTNFSLIWLGSTILPVLLLYGGMLVLGRNGGIYGTLLPLSAMTVMWATRNRGARVMLYGLIPLSAPILGWLTVLFVLLSYGSESPILGLVACLHLAVAYGLADGRIPGVALTEANQSYKPSKAKLEREERELADAARRRAERDEKDKLKDLFERSGIEDR
jgi:uncharacterized membrane protein YraQ (UPF0718 family)